MPRVLGDKSAQWPLSIGADLVPNSAGDVAVREGGRVFTMLALLLPVQLLLADCHSAPNAVAADPDHYSVEFENDALRVVRIKYGPGETSTMHSHDANCVVFLNGGETRMELPDGSSAPAPANAPGAVNCSDAVVHLPTNVGGTDVEVIMLEMKGRTSVN